MHHAASRALSPRSPPPCLAQSSQDEGSGDEAPADDAALLEQAYDEAERVRVQLHSEHPNGLVNIDSAADWERAMGLQDACVEQRLYPFYSHAEIRLDEVGGCHA